MELMIVLLLVSCGVILLVGSRGERGRKPCPACRSSNPVANKRCAYCTTWLVTPEEPVSWRS